MNCTQNKKIEQVKETTMIVGIDVGSEKHYFRAFNWRGIELTRKPVAFSNSMEGFKSFYNTIVELMQKSELEEALVGIEPTGHYWFDLGQFMGEKDIKFVMVNPHHVHKTKELDDNSPSKNDRKDPRVIAGLVTYIKGKRWKIFLFIYADRCICRTAECVKPTVRVCKKNRQGRRTVCRNGLQCISQNIREFIHT